MQTSSSTAINSIFYEKKIGINQLQNVVSVDIIGIEQAKASIMHSLLTVKAGGQHNRSEVSADVRRLMMTGEFSNVGIKIEQSSKGLNVTYLIERHFELKLVKVTGTKFLPHQEIERMFKHQIGYRINLNKIFGTLARIEKWYHEHNQSITFDILAVKEDRLNGTLAIKMTEIPVEDFKITTTYRAMRTDIVRMRITAESLKV